MHETLCDGQDTSDRLVQHDTNPVHSTENLWKVSIHDWLTF